MPFRWTQQPLKALYTLAVLLAVPPYLAYLSLKYVAPGLRPNPRHSLRQSIGIALLRRWFSYAAAVEFRFPLTLDPGKEGDRWQVVRKPAPRLALPQAPTAATSSSGPSRAAPIGGVWSPRRWDRDADADARVVLHIHGGAFVLVGARDVDVACPSQVLCSTGVGSTAFFPQYRLSPEPGCAFPVPLYDVVAAYQYLLELGIAPQRIVLSGDSAGGNLVLALLRLLEDPANQLPKPAAALAWSPWVDLDFNPQAVRQKHAADFIPVSLMEWGRRVYCAGGEPPSSGWISPAQAPFKSSVPLMVTAGGSELTCDAINQFATRMKQAGSQVKYVELGDSPHDAVAAGAIAGFMEEALHGGREAAKFLDDLGL